MTLSAAMFFAASAPVAELQKVVDHSDFAVRVVVAGRLPPESPLLAGMVGDKSVEVQRVLAARLPAASPALEMLLNSDNASVVRMVARRLPEASRLWPVLVTHPDEDVRVSAAWRAPGGLLPALLEDSQIRVLQKLAIRSPEGLDLGPILARLAVHPDPWIRMTAASRLGLAELERWNLVRDSDPMVAEFARQMAGLEPGAE